MVFLYFFLNAYINYELADYDSSIVDYTKAINLCKLNFGKIDPFTGYQFGSTFGGALSHLFLDRAKVFKEIKEVDGCCNDYNTALQLTDEGSNEQKEIQKLISETCNSE